MSFLLATDRTHADRFSCAKSIGQIFLSAALIANDVKSFYDIIVLGEGAVKYFWALVAVIAVNLALQLTTLIMAIILSTCRYPCHAHHHNVSMTDIRNVPSPADDMSDGGGKPTTEQNGDVQTHLDHRPPPCRIKRNNDALTIITFIIVGLSVIKNGLLHR